MNRQEAINKSLFHIEQARETLEECTDLDQLNEAQASRLEIVMLQTGTAKDHLRALARSVT